MLLARDAIPLGLKRYRTLMVMMKVEAPSSSPSMSGFSPHSRGGKEGRGESGRPTSPLVDYSVNLQLQPAKEDYARLKRPRSRRLARARLPTGITRGKCHDRQRLGICRYNRSYRAASSPQLGWPM